MASLVSRRLVLWDNWLSVGCCADSVSGRARGSVA